MGTDTCVTGQKAMGLRGGGEICLGSRHGCWRIGSVTQRVGPGVSWPTHFKGEEMATR